MAMKLEVVEIGDSLGVILPDEMLAKLNAVGQSEIEVRLLPDGLELMRFEPEKSTPTHGGEGLSTVDEVNKTDPVIDPTVARLQTPDECEQYIENVQEKYPELAVQALQRKVALAANTYNPADECERDCYAAILAYEEVLLSEHGKRVRANRTWQKISRDGLLPAVEAWVRKDADPSGYVALKRIGLLYFTFEAVVLRYPDRFSPEAVEMSRKRLNKQT